VPHAIATDILPVYTAYIPQYSKSARNAARSNLAKNEPRIAQKASNHLHVQQTTVTMA